MNQLSKFDEMAQFVKSNVIFISLSSFKTVRTKFGYTVIPCQMSLNWCHEILHLNTIRIDTCYLVIYGYVKEKQWQNLHLYTSTLSKMSAKCKTLD